MHECNHEAKISGMATDIKWIRETLEEDRATLKEHLKDSSPRVQAIDRNTTWRHIFKAAGAGIYAILAWLAIRK